MRIVQITAASGGLLLIVLSIVSQVQGLLGGRGFLEQQQVALAILGAGLVIVAFIALAVQKRRRPEETD
ncbi:hypothetical protein [Salinibacterium sp. PAMC 21357]|uniref:hypothetical protein n=1 Tax=Salinibacterium sp. PAMC 21357 TaxID=1112215 RepID=UPI0011464057|nr:hypothetical protein [Salinibacterium sp. PAMC 21357]